MRQVSAVINDFKVPKKVDLTIEPKLPILTPSTVVDQLKDL